MSVSRGRAWSSNNVKAFAVTAGSCWKSRRLSASRKTGDASSKYGVPGPTSGHVSHAAPELQAKAAEVFPRARQTISKAIARGVKVACGTDAPAIPHGRNAKELVALVDRGMTPVEAIRAATTVSAELIDADDRGRIAPGLYADIIGVPGDPTVDITLTEQVKFVMKGGDVYRNDPVA